ncbi:MAG: lysophospholipid acyltransferase family protein [Planctomycetota bacterium]
MRHVRAISRLACAAAWTLACYAGWLATRPLALVSRAAAQRTHAWFVRTWARAVAHTLCLRVTVEGAVPAPPYFLVANHLSYLDIVALWTQVDGAFLAKAEVARWPVIGLLARSVGTCFIDRTRKSDVPRAVATLGRALHERGGVIVFPEGTSSAGEHVLPFRPSIFEVAAASGTPVCCASLAYEAGDGEPPASQSVCWWGDMPFGAHLYRLCGLRAVHARIAFSHERLAHPDRKHLAARAHALVAGRLRPAEAV